MKTWQKVLLWAGAVLGAALLIFLVVKYLVALVLVVAALVFFLRFLEFGTLSNHGLRRRAKARRERRERIRKIWME